MDALARFAKHSRSYGEEEGGSVAEWFRALDLIFFLVGVLSVHKH